jgi:hypothetical protein
MRVLDCARAWTVSRRDPGVTETWSLPGYHVQARLASGAHGEVWRAREVSSGQLVALKRLRPDADPAAVAALRREAEALRALDTPYVVRLRDVVGEGAGTVLVLDLAAGGSLAALLSRRGPLDPGEVVTVAVPVAQALAVAHDAGIVHGDVSPANVLFTDDGMPLLADLSTARTALMPVDRLDATAEYLDPAVAAGGRPTGASDVWALAAVCHHLLVGSPPHEGRSVDDVLGAARDGGRAPLGLLAPNAPRALVDVIEAALVHDPALRPDAAAFAAAVRRAHAAAPVRFDGPAAAGPVPDVRETHVVPRHAVAATVPAAPGRQRRRTPRWLAPAAVGLVLLIAAAVIGWQWGRGPDAAPVAAPVGGAAMPASPVESASTPDWPELLDQLDAARAEAFAAADAARLDAVYAPDSPGLLADRALVEQLAAAGRTATGVRHEVREVEQSDAGADAARLRVIDVLSAYEVRDAAGAVVTRTPARGEAAYVVELARTPDGWRLVQVTPA